MTDSRKTSAEGGPGPRRARRFPRLLLIVGVLLPLSILLFSCSGCSPVYLAKAGWAEMKILRGRRPFEEVISDVRTDEETRRKLRLARQARAFAIHMLGLNAGDSYTSFTQLEKDTLAWVLSAAHKDRLESKTWWFPIVGRMPYKGYFSEDGARKAQGELEKKGLDTYLRTTSAFSTLGWFADPLVSSLLRYDDVDLVETIIHEVSHNHLFVKGRVRFNESFATFVGRTGAIRFFCGPDEAPQNVSECQIARDRWVDYQAFSRFLDEFIGDLESIYEAPEMTVESKVTAREKLFETYQTRFQVGEGLDPAADPPPGSPLVRSFLSRPLNNATLLARMRYFHRLSDFQTLLDQHQGDLKATVADLTERAPSVDDPFLLLPEGPPI